MAASYRGVVGLLLVLGVALWYWSESSTSRISTYYMRQISQGMTLGQVQDILGGPPGDYRTPPLAGSGIGIASSAGECWRGDRLSIFVRFDAAGRVEGITGFYPGKMRPSWYHALQEWLPLPD